MQTIVNFILLLEFCAMIKKKDESFYVKNICLLFTE